MEGAQTENLFGLSINSNSKEHLSEAARWARFLAITGMIMLGLVVLLMLVGSTFFFSSFTNLSGASFGGGGTMVFLAFWVIAAAALWFFPLLFTLRFASKMKAALATDDQQLLNESFQNLKITFRYLGIVTIIIVALYALVFAFAGVGAAMAI